MLPPGRARLSTKASGQHRIAGLCMTRRELAVPFHPPESRRGSPKAKTDIDLARPQFIDELRPNRLSCISAAVVART